MGEGEAGCACTLGDDNHEGEDGVYRSYFDEHTFGLDIRLKVCTYEGI